MWGGNIIRGQIIGKHNTFVLRDDRVWRLFTVEDAGPDNGLSMMSKS